MQSCLAQIIKGSAGAEQIPEPAKEKEIQSFSFSRLSELERTLIH